LIEQLEQLTQQAEKAVRDASDAKTLEEVRVRFLGKSGLVTEMLKGLGRVRVYRVAWEEGST